MAPHPRDILLHITPIRGTRNASTSSGISSNSNSLPQSLQHWSVQVDQKVYGVVQVASGSSTSGAKNNGKYEVRIAPYSVWKAKYPAWMIHTIKVGQTLFSDTQLERAATLIWDIFISKTYDVFDQNCQGFAEVFRETIIADSSANISDSERATWKELPHKLSLSPVLTLVSRGVWSHRSKAHQWCIGVYDPDGKSLHEVDDLEPILLKADKRYKKWIWIENAAYAATILIPLAIKLL